MGFRTAGHRSGELGGVLLSTDGCRGVDVSSETHVAWGKPWESGRALSSAYPRMIMGSDLKELFFIHRCPRPCLSLAA